MKSAFAGYHPAVNFVYFVLILVVTMLFFHPLFLALSLLGSFLWLRGLKGGGGMGKSLLFALPMAVMAALLNPLFNHEGETVLTHLPGGAPLTLESVLYGLAAAVMLLAVLNWFGCYHIVMTSDKFLCLFGRAAPALSLVLSMVLRFVPRLKERFRVVSNAQKCVGRDVSDGSLTDKVRHGVRILSILLTWSLESAVDTADSMRSRGYGLPGRSSYSVYRMEKRDKDALAWMIGLGCCIAAAGLAGGTDFRYFPHLEWTQINGWGVAALLAWAGLCFAPAGIDAAERRRWNEEGKEGDAE